jgi:WD40 repeat protein
VSFSPDGKRIVSGGGELLKPGEIKVWDAQTGQETLTLKGHSNNVFSVSFSPDGHRIVSGSLDQTMEVWDISSLDTSENAAAGAPKTKADESPAQAAAADPVAALEKIGAKIKRNEQGEVVELNLRYTQITDAGLRHLKGLTNLKKLDFEDTQVTDAGWSISRG